MIFNATGNAVLLKLQLLSVLRKYWLLSKTSFPVVTNVLGGQHLFYDLLFSILPYCVLEHEDITDLWSYQLETEQNYCCLDHEYRADGSSRSVLLHTVATQMIQNVFVLIEYDQYCLRRPVPDVVLALRLHVRREGNSYHGQWNLFGNMTYIWLLSLSVHSWAVTHCNMDDTLSQQCTYLDIVNQI